MAFSFAVYTFLPSFFLSLSLSSFGYDYTLPLIIRIRHNIPLELSVTIWSFDYGTAREPYGSDYG